MIWFPSLKHRFLSLGKFQKVLFLFKLKVRGDRGRASHNLLVIPTLPAYDLTTLKFTTIGPGKPARDTVQISKDNKGNGFRSLKSDQKTHCHCSQIRTLQKEQY